MVIKHLGAFLKEKYGTFLFEDLDIRKKTYLKYQGYAMAMEEYESTQNTNNILKAVKIVAESMNLTEKKGK